MTSEIVIEIDPQRCSGKPVIAKTRFTVAQLIAELADGQSLQEVCENYDLNYSLCEKVLRQVALEYDQPRGAKC